MTKQYLQGAAYNQALLSMMKTLISSGVPMPHERVYLYDESTTKTEVVDSAGVRAIARKILSEVYKIPEEI